MDKNGISYDQLLTAFKKRVSCRTFTEMPVQDECMLKIAEAGKWAASGHNAQTAKIIRVKNPDIREALRAKTSATMTGHGGFDPFYGAPELLIVVASGPLAAYDGSLAMANMMLAADSLGLGCCWINTAQTETLNERNSIIAKLAREVGIAGRAVGVGYLVVGHPSGRAAAKDRLPERYFEI